jgi:hypothetical protein
VRGEPEPESGPEFRNIPGFGRDGENPDFGPEFEFPAQQ